MSISKYTEARMQAFAVVLAAQGVGGTGLVRTSDVPSFPRNVLRLEMDDGSWWEITMHAKLMQIEGGD